MHKCYSFVYKLIRSRKALNLNNNNNNNTRFVNLLANVPVNEIPTQLLRVES